MCVSCVVFFSCEFVFTLRARTYRFFVQVPREAADKLIFEEEAKERAKKEAKVAEEKSEREKAKKGKVFAHLSGGGGSSSGGASDAKPPAPPSSSAEAAAAAEGVEERWDSRGMVCDGRGGGGGVEGGEEEEWARLCCALLVDELHASVNLSRYQQRAGRGGGRAGWGKVDRNGGMWCHEDRVEEV